MFDHGVFFSSFSGDCIYIPSDWVFQSNVVSVENSLEFKWKPEPWTPDEECSKGLKKRFLSTLNFPGEEYEKIDLTLDNHETLMKKVEKVLDKVLTRERKQFSFEKFMTDMIQDESLLQDLQVEIFF